MKRRIISPKKKEGRASVSPASMKKKNIYVKKHSLYLLITIQGICDETVMRD